MLEGFGKVTLVISFKDYNGTAAKCDTTYLVDGYSSRRPSICGQCRPSTIATAVVVHIYIIYICDDNKRREDC